MVDSDRVGDGGIASDSIRWSGKWSAKSSAVIGLSDSVSGVLELVSCIVASGQRILKKEDTEM